MKEKDVFKINDIVIMDNGDGDIISALFKGYINEKLCYIKPKARFKHSGYGQTVTCLVSKVKSSS